MSFTSSKVGPDICRFSPFQQLLIKSRLFAYRESLGSNSSTRSWANIARDITNLPELDKLSPTKREEVRKRFRYYLLTQPRRGRTKPTPLEIEQGCFQVSDDTLNRWFTEPKAREDGNRGRALTPSSQVIAAIRDFLIVQGYLLEAELTCLDLPIAGALALNEFAAFEGRRKDSLLPTLEDRYVGFSAQESAFITRALRFETFDEAGYVQFIEETKKYDVPGQRDFATLIKSKKRRPNLTLCRVGWVALGLMPSLILFSRNSSDLDQGAQVQCLCTIETTSNKITLFALHGAESYLSFRGEISSLTREIPPHFYATPDHKSIIEYFNDNMYTDYYDDYIFASCLPGMDDFKTLDHAEKMRLGKDVYNAIKAYIKSANPNDISDVSLKIRMGADINYCDQRDGACTIHLVAASACWSELYHLLSAPNLNLLTRNKDGLLPSDLAFRVSDEMGALLTIKQIDQAKREGKTISNILGRNEVNPVQDTGLFPD